MLNAILQKLDYADTDVLQYSDKPWLSHYQKGVPESKIYDEICLPEVLKNGAESHPDRMALVFEGYRLSYGRLNEMIDRMAACLRNLGIRKGDRVALLLPNCIPCIAGYYAILKIGGIVVMNNPLYSDRELLYQFNDSGAKLLITLDLLANRMIDLRPKTGIQDIIYTSLGDYLPFPKNHLFKLVAKRRKLAADVKPASRIYRWKDLLKNSPAPGPQVKVRPDDIAMYQYTGGTTGISKGVLLSHRNLSVQVQQISAWCPELHCDDGVMLGALPFFHVFGLSTTMNFAIYMGWGNILLPRPTPETLLKAIRKFRPSFAPLVPTMFIGILEHPDIEKTDLTSLRGCFSGSAPLPVEVIRKFEQKTGAVIVEGYGLQHRRADQRHPVPDCGSGRRENRGAGGKTRRTSHSGPSGDAGILEHARRNRKRHGGRMAPHRRRRGHGRGRLFLHRGPQEGHDHIERLQRLSPGNRRSSPRTSQGAGGLRRGHSPQLPGRGGQGVCHLERKPDRHLRGTH